MMRMRAQRGSRISSGERSERKETFCTRLPFVFFVLTVLFRSAVLFPQTKSLQVTIDKISITDSTRYRNVPASFPYPVHSLVTVKDQNNHYVHGLADTTRWLSAQDLNQNGNRVDDVWNTLLERHQEDSTKPADPDIKHAQPGYLVTEISDVEGFGLSTALVMDYSGSMIPYFKDAEAASHVFIDQMRTSDRAAVIKFSGDVYVMQDFTSDTTLLRKAIDYDSTSYSGTSIYDAIYTGITLALNQPGRKAVIAYTDGRDHLVGHTIDEVIAYANQQQVAVFTIGLFGTGPRYDTLERIANETGGTYAFAPTVEHLKEIYRSIYGIIRGYYVLAYRSPDPFFNGTWRQLSLHVHHSGIEGTATGRYYAPFVAPNLQVQAEAKTDSVNSANGSPRYYLMAGDTAEYRIHLVNNSRGQANEIRLTDALPDSIHPFGFSIAPQKIQNDTLFWSFPILNPGESIEISYKARASRIMPYGTTELDSRINVTCYRDSLSEDNFASATVYGLGFPDFTVRCLTPQTKMSPGYPFPVTAVVENQGNADIVRPFQIGFFSNGSRTQPAAMDTIPSLAVGETATVQSPLMFPQSGNYTVRAVADAQNALIELDESNNADSSQVRVGIDSVRIRISGISLKDTVRGKAGSFPKPVLTCVLAVDQNLHPVRGFADSSKWAGLNDPSNLGSSIGSFWTEAREYHDDNPMFPIVQDVRPGLQITEIGRSAVVPLVLFDGSEAMQPWIARVQQRLDAWFTRFASADRAGVAILKETLQWLQTFTSDRTLLRQSLHASCTAKSRPLYDGLVQSVDWASAAAGRKSVLLFSAGPDQGSAGTCASTVRHAREKGVPVFVIRMQNPSVQDSLTFLAEKTGGWFFPVTNDSLLDLAVARTDEMLRNHYALAHTSSDTLQDLTWRAMEIGFSAFGKVRKDKNLYLAPRGFANLAVTVAGRGTAWTRTAGDTAWSVRTNDQASYRITIRNTGHQDVNQIRLASILPHNLVPGQSGNYTVHGDTVLWSFPSLAIRSSIETTLSCRVDTVFTTSNSALVNRVAVQAVQDSYLRDNSDADTMTYIPLKLADLSVRIRGTGDSTSVVRRDTLRYAHAGKLVTYRATLMNQGEIACRNIRIRNVLPDRVSLVSFPGTPFVQLGDTLTWSIDRLESRGASRVFTYTCKVDTFMPPWETALANRITANGDQDSDLKNNTHQDTVWTAGVVPPKPDVRTSPATVEPRDSVSVEVMSPVLVKTWNLRIVFQNGEQVTNYAQPFIQATPLLPGTWIRIVPAFADTRMRTTEIQERVAIVLQTTDYWDVVRTDTAYVTIRSNDEIFLDRNVFNPRNDGSLGIRFKISSLRSVNITVYDIAGGYIQTVADGMFDAGWNQVGWNGLNDRNQTAGSGVYLAVISSAGFKKALKFILVR